MQHSTTECWALRRLVNHKIIEGTLELTQPKVQRNSLPNHKGKGVAANLFDQLKFIANERKVAIKALVSISSREGVECLVVET